MTNAGQILRRLFPPEVRVAGGAPEEASGALFPEEEQVVVRAVAKRRDEFRAGRLFARAALAELGMAESPIPADGRRPVWPDGILGTISHANGCCGVAVASALDLAGIGLDIEEQDAVTEGMHRHILTPREQERLASGAPDRRARRATLIFSAKEAFYKSLAELRRGYVGFHEVRIEPEEDGTFAVCPESEGVRETLRPVEVTGRYVSTESWVFTGVTLRPGR